jgi:hypothetical protein
MGVDADGETETAWSRLVAAAPGGMAVDHDEVGQPRGKALGRWWGS